jgi:hypothetical protein
MNKRPITMGLKGATAVVTGFGIALPELFTGIASMGLGGTSLFSALQVYKDSARKKINKMLLQELR